MTRDLAAANEKAPGQVGVICGGAGRGHPLADILLPCDARFQAVVGGSLTALNARVARKLLADPPGEWTFAAARDRLAGVRHPETQLHLLGLNRLDHVAAFQGFGVTSFDSTSPLTQAFKDDRDNYYAPGRTYTAVRVRIADPKVNPELRRLIAKGETSQPAVLRLEDETWAKLLAFAGGRAGLEETLAAVLRYEQVFDPGLSNAARYHETLADRPWEKCGCAICRAIGIHAVLFRGAERNRRRGFHNLWVTYRELQAARTVEPPGPTNKRSKRAAND